MGGTTSMFYSGAVEAAAGIIVSGVVSSIQRRYEMPEAATGTVVRTDVSSIKSEYEMEEELNVTLYSLQHEVSKIKSAIEAARGRRITNQMLLKWLAQIIDAEYLGEYYYRTFKNQSSHPPMIASTEGTSNLLINYPNSRAAKRQRAIKTLLFGNDVHRELHDVLKMLKSIDMCVFLQMVNALPERPMKRHFYMDPAWLIGRGKGREQIMKFLFEPSMARENNVDILPIVGSSGAGKTTLAHHCFYDPKVQKHFSLKIFIPSISYLNNGCPPKIFEYILKECKSTPITNNDENTLLAMLKQNLSSERILLLINNDWLMNSAVMDSTVWNDMLGCIRCGKQGSKIIFISDLIFYNKIKEVVKPGKVQPIILDGLSEEEYMLFFKEHAFGSADPEDHPELKKLGGEIAKMMNGSFWGAKILGEILRDNLNAPFWSIFLQDGFISSQFLQRKGHWPAIETISQLLPMRLQLTGMTVTWGEESLLFRQCDELKSYRELMVLCPKYCTPVITEGGNYRVKFSVVIHFNLHESTVVVAECKPIGNNQ